MYVCVESNVGKLPTDTRYWRFIMGQPEGKPGADGREIVLRVDLNSKGTFLQWKYKGDKEWKNLIQLDDLSLAYKHHTPDSVVIALMNNKTEIKSGVLFEVEDPLYIEYADKVNPYSDVPGTMIQSIKIKIKEKIEPGQFTITATADTGGTISPAGLIIVNQGDSKTFYISPNTGFKIQKVLVDGVYKYSAVSTGEYTFEDIQENHTIHVIFKEIPVSFILHTEVMHNGVTYGGTIYPLGNTTLLYNTPFVVQIDADDGYVIDELWRNGVLVTDATNKAKHVVASPGIQNDECFHVKFKMIPTDEHIIFVSHTEGGWIDDSMNPITGTPGSPAEVKVISGGSVTFNFAPNPGYYTYEVLVDGVNQPTSVINGYHKFMNVTKNYTFHVVFLPIEYEIVATSSNDGKGDGIISPSGPISVTHGGSQTFVITPNIGSSLENLIVDGASVAFPWTGGTYTFTNVTSNHKIEAVFAIIKFNITMTFEGNGTVNPSGLWTPVDYGGSQKYTFVADPGWHIESVLINGTENTTAVANGWYEFTNVTDSDNTIHIIFAEDIIGTHVITASATNGTITPSGSVTVINGTNQTFNFAPNTDYKISQVLIDGTNNPSAVTSGTYTFSNVTSSHSIQVNCVPSTHTIAVSTETLDVFGDPYIHSGGIITPVPVSGKVTVSSGSNQTFTITPNSYYKIDKVYIDGTTSSDIDWIATLTGSYTFYNVLDNSHSIKVVFRQVDVGQVNFVFHHYTGSPWFTPPSPPAMLGGTWSITENGGPIKLPSFGSSGSVFPQVGSNVVVTFAPLPGYAVRTVTIDGILKYTNEYPFPGEIDFSNGGTYTFTNVSPALTHQIIVEFEYAEPVIDFNYDIGLEGVANIHGWGLINGTGTLKVRYGDIITINPIDAAPGYEIDQVIINGVNNPVAVSNKSYVFNNITGSNSIKITFKIETSSVFSATLNNPLAFESVSFNSILNGYQFMLPARLADNECNMWGFRFHNSIGNAIDEFRQEGFTPGVYELVAGWQTVWSISTNGIWTTVLFNKQTLGECDSKNMFTQKYLIKLKTI